MMSNTMINNSQQDGHVSFSTSSSLDAASALTSIKVKTEPIDDNFCNGPIPDRPTLTRSVTSKDTTAGCSWNNPLILEDENEDSSAPIIAPIIIDSDDDRIVNGNIMNEENFVHDIRCVSPTGQFTTIPDLTDKDYEDGIRKQAKNKGPSMRKWVFTKNNPTPEERKFLMDTLPTNERVAECAIGYEIGKNGTPHLQGYIGLTQNNRRSFLMGPKVLNFKCWCEPAKAGMQANLKYTQKQCIEGYTIVKHKKSQQGKR